MNYIFSGTDYNKKEIKNIPNYNSFIDIRYPNLKEYSFHWRGRNKVIRIDTAPHHINLRSYPRHIHLYTEDNMGLLSEFIARVSRSDTWEARSWLRRTERLKLI